MHLMYVDESGDPGYPQPGLPFPPSGGPTRYFARAGVVVHDHRWRKVDSVIAQFKASHHLNWNSEIKATDIRRGNGAFAGWRQEDRQVLVDDLLDTVNRELDITLIVVIIDKSKVDRTAPKRYSDPSVRSLELILEQYDNYLSKQSDRCGAVILDSVEESKDDNLRYFQNYLRLFSDTMDRRRIVEGTLFMPSHTTNLLQIADVCTNVVYRKHVGTKGGIIECGRIQGRIVSETTWP